MRAKIVAGINAQRKKRGLPALRENVRLTRAAQSHSEAMAREDFFDHRDKRGRGPSERIEAAGYRWRAVAENIALNEGYGDPGVRAVEGWLRSEGHRRNLLGDYVETGVGAARRGRRWYFTQVFARPMR